MGNGIKLLLMIFVGFLCIMVGVRGQLGSLLGAVLTPQYMQGPAQGAYNAQESWTIAQNIPGVGTFLNAGQTTTAP